MQRGTTNGRSSSRRTRQRTTDPRRWRRHWSRRTRISRADRRTAGGSVWPVSRINELSNAYVADHTRLSPMLATYLGVPGGESRLDDLSPAGLDEVHDLQLSTLRALADAEPTNADELIAREVL